MSIHTVIQDRRKALGLTQEQIAEYLGVTTPAVNKWEKGSTCPDILLLPPLARLLKIDLNTLFDFNGNMSRQELILFCKEIHETVLTDGFEAAFSLAQAKLREYPNNDTLLHNLALQMQGLLATAGLGENESVTYLKQIDAWYEQLTQSKEEVIRNGACYMLASRAISNKQFEKAQEYLDQMPNRNDTPDKRMLQATIYLNQDRAEDAAELLERTLMTSINDMQMVLYKLIDTNIAVGDYETASYVSERATRLAEAFDLNHYNTMVAPLQMAVASKNAERTVALLQKMLKAMSNPWDIHTSPLYRRISVNDTGATLEKMIKPMLQSLRKAPECAYLQAYPEFQKLLRSVYKELHADHETGTADNK